ncbi:MAG TPA: class I SAM-dependent methyltransferase [Pseudoxanthomonas sp.]
MDNGGRARSEAWSSYWKSGALHSCIGSYAGNYGGAIEEFWNSVFGRLQEDSKVLDIATGNGALPKLLLDGFPDRFAHVDAVDYSTVAPAWYDPEKMERIAFHPNVAMEQLPFANRGFDAVISQYGLEYGRRPESLEECLRVAKESAVFAFIWHHADGVLVRVAEQEVAHIDRLLADDGLVAAAMRIVPWLEAARKDPSAAGTNAEALECRALYNASMSRLAEAIDASSVPDLLLESRERVHALVASAGAVEAQTLLEKLRAYREGLASARLRSAEMVSSALDVQQARDIQAYFKRMRPALHTRLEPVSQGAEGTIGWGFVAAMQEE